MYMKNIPHTHTHTHTHTLICGFIPKKTHFQNMIIVF